MGCHSNRSRCLTHDLWAELGNQIHLFLSAVTLADVCEKRVLGTARLMQSGEGAKPAAAEQTDDMVAAE